MPVRLQSKSDGLEQAARIEIIPLIDIMFFLLASFMLVSLSMVNHGSITINLPAATTAVRESIKTPARVSIDRNGEMFLDDQQIDDHALIDELSARNRRNPGLRVYISGDRNARHADIIHALDAVRLAGIQRIAFDTRPTEAKK